MVSAVWLDLVFRAPTSVNRGVKMAIPHSDGTVTPSWAPWDGSTPHRLFPSAGPPSPEPADLRRRKPGQAR
jgi:hypothetical protein